MRERELEKVTVVPEMELENGIKLSGITAFYGEDTDDDERWLHVLGEATSTKSAKLSGDISIVATGYRDDGKVVGIGEHRLYEDDFRRMETFEIRVDLRSPSVDSVKVFPRRA